MPTRPSGRFGGAACFAILGILLSTLTGCFIPENFTAKVTVSADGSAVFDYRGNLAFVPAVAQIAQGGTLSAKDEADLAKAKADLEKEPGFQSVAYLGKGRYKVHFRKDIPAGSEFHFLSEEFTRYFSIRTAPAEDGRTALFITSQIQIDDEARRQWGPILNRVRGTLTAEVPKRFKVIESNGEDVSGPLSGWFGNTRTFRWQITPQTREKPRLVVAMPE